ncbi:MAG: hypothetical protein ACOYL6_16890 [Bacteriovoracaceae bacterium]
MKKIFIRLLLLSSVAAFAKEPLFMVSYGPINEQLKSFNFQFLKDSRIPLGGREDIISERCLNILKEVQKEQNGIHGYLLLNNVGDTNGICLIKASLNY